MAIVTAKQASPIDMMKGQPVMGEEAAEPAGQAAETAGFSIEIACDSQGNITVSLESGKQEAAEGSAPEEQGSPAQSIDDALKIAKEMYLAETGEAGGPAPQDVWNEEAAKRGPATATGY